MAAVVAVVVEVAMEADAKVKEEAVAALSTLMFQEEDEAEVVEDMVALHQTMGHLAISLQQPDNQKSKRLMG
jgi:hypothetical protein